MVFETCGTLVLLDGCRACASFSKESLKWDGKKWKWDGGGRSDTFKARRK